MCNKANRQISVFVMLFFMLFSVACASENTQDKLDVASTATTTSVPDSTIPASEPQAQEVDELTVNWTVYEEENGLFLIEHPQGWSVEAPLDLDSQTPVNVWQFRGEQTAPQFVQSVTLGRYMIPTISADTSLETWFEQVNNNEFEFERLFAESTEVNGHDAYTVHTRYRPPERDAYVTYIRCQNKVWFLQTLDIDLESTTMEEIYTHMLNSLSLGCDQ